MFVHLRRLRRQQGLSTAEYVILLVLLAAVAVASFQLFGLRVKCGLLLALGQIDSQLSGSSYSLAAQCANVHGGNTEGTVTVSPAKLESPPSAASAAPAESCAPQSPPTNPAAVVR
jgi:Flp pilus assembly pilin Flp